MISSTLLNLIVSIVAVGVFVLVVRAAHLVAGDRFEELSTKTEVETSFDFERAA
jgi:hypothetical protein